jgi:site-specific recombinase XerD
MTVSAGPLVVARSEGSHRLEGSWADLEMANAFLTHLEVREFSPATVRAYAFDLLNFGRFLGEKKLTLVDVVPTDLFDYLGLL